MCLCRRSALWVGCTVLVLAFLAVEELADVTYLPALADPLAPEYIEDEDSNWEEYACEADEAAEPDAPEPSAAAGTAQAADRDPAARATRDGRGRTVKRVCRVTAYCDRGLTAAGIPSGVGQCAAPADIPLGSTVYIPALKRTFVVTDRTHRRFRHNTVDVFIPSEKQCLKFGRHYLECDFTLAETPVRYGQLRLAQNN